MSGVFESLVEYLKNRMNTQAYGIFAFWWLVVHWEFFYTLVFVDQDKILAKTSMLKNEYLHYRYYDYSTLAFWCQLFISLLVSLGLTALMIWILPKYVLLHAYRAEKEHETSKRLIKIGQEQLITEAQERLERASTDRLKATKEKVTVEKDIEAIDPTVLLEEQYEKFKVTRFFNDFEELIDAKYRYGGEVRKFNENGNTIFRLDEDLLAYADSTGLVRFDMGRIDFTEKGKYFVGRYKAENP